LGRRGLIAGALAVAVLAGCGGGDRAPAGPTLKEAKATFELACLQGSHDRLDRRLCRCIVREASRRAEYDSPGELAILSRRTAAAMPAALDTVARRCADRIGGAG
jgi:hypothetical protein